MNVKVTEVMHWQNDNATGGLLTKLKRDLLIRNDASLLRWINSHDDEGNTKITIWDATWGLTVFALLLIIAMLFAFILRLRKHRTDSLDDQRIVSKDRRIERRPKFNRSMSLNDITCRPGVIIL